MRFHQSCDVSSDVVTFIAYYKTVQSMSVLLLPLRLPLPLTLCNMRGGNWLAMVLAWLAVCGLGTIICVL